MHRLPVTSDERPGDPQIIDHSRVMQPLCDHHAAPPATVIHKDMVPAHARYTISDYLPAEGPVGASPVSCTPRPARAVGADREVPENNLRGKAASVFTARGPSGLWGGHEERAGPLEGVFSAGDEFLDGQGNVGFRCAVSKPAPTRTR